MVPKRLILSCLLAALPALAQAPAPAPNPAPAVAPARPLAAVAGPAVSVPAPARRPGAIGSAKDDDLPLPPPRVGPDVTLMRAVLWAFEPSPAEIRTLAVEDLGLLGDPRALNALAQLAVDPNPSIGRAAVRAVGLFVSPRAEEILSNVVRHPTLAEPIKLLALDLVPFQNTDSSLRFVRLVAQGSGFSYGLQNQARRMVGELPADRGALSP